MYEAESPDELALIDAAYAYNCKLLKRSPDRLTVSLPGDGQVSVAGDAAEISAAVQIFFCLTVYRLCCRRRRNFCRWPKKKVRKK